MSSAILIRHELLRHEAIRAHSLTFNKFDCPQYIVECGFYYEPNSKRIYCFSCHFNLCYSPNYIKLHEVHKIWSKHCSFLQGKDVSIKSPRMSITMERVGWPSVSYNEDLNRSVNSQLRGTRDIENPPIYTTFNKTRGTYLRVFYSPVRIPPNGTDRSVLDVDYLYTILKREEMRRKSFFIQGYRFPFDEEYIDLLVKSGFFYTLFNNAISCAFCRLVLNGKHPQKSIERFHRQFSPNCDFFCKDNQNIPMQPSEQSETLPIDMICVICLTECKTYVTIPCMHLTHCHNCITKLKSPNCVICRHEGVQYRRIFI